MTEQEYQEYMARATQLPEARKNDPQKGYAGARGSRSVFPVSPDVQTMLMFVDPKGPGTRNALLIVGANNGITEAQQTSVLCSANASDASSIRLLHGRPQFVVDEVAAIPAAIPLEDSLKKYKEGYLRVLFFGDPSGQAAMDEANAAAARFGVDFTRWTAAQLGNGKGPGVGPAGIPLK